MGTIVLATKGESFEEAVTASETLVELSKQFIASARLLELSAPEGLAGGGNVFKRPAETDLRALVSAAQRAGMLHTLRPFVLSEEPLFVPKYLGAIRRENTGEVVQAATMVIRNAFLVRDSTISLEANTASGRVEFERQWQDYANAYEYHQSRAKREKLERELGPNKAMAEFVFIFAALMKVKTVLSMRGLATMMAGDADRFEIDVREVDLAAKPAA